MVSTTMGIALLTSIGLCNLLGPFTKFVGLDAGNDTQKIYLQLELVAH